MYMYVYIYICMYTLLSTCIHITLDAGSPNPEGDKGRSRQEPFWTPGGPWSKSSKASAYPVGDIPSFIMAGKSPNSMEVSSGVWENHPWKIMFKTRNHRSFLLVENGIPLMVIINRPGFSSATQPCCK